jgi:hypothetical protein
MSFFRLRQRSRLTWIRAGDTNTKLFHLKATAKRHHNFILSLLHAGRLCITHEAKSEALHDFYSQQFGSTTTRQHTLNWETLQVQRYELSDLEREVTETEIHAAVMQTRPEKAPGSHGFIRSFYKECWGIIKVDVIIVIKEIFTIRANCWNLLNSANVVLLEKKNGAQVIGDYIPISVMHNNAKILAKILANRLAPHLDQIVSHSQSAFIKGRSIHDNFQYVQGAVKHFHQAKTPMLLFKLDIAKTFDSVCWEYLLDPLEQMGFNQRWRDMLSLIWSTMTSRIMLNGEPSRQIKHSRGPRQVIQFH